MLRTRFVILTALMVVCLSLPAASVARPTLVERGRESQLSNYDRALLAHDRLEPVHRGQALMDGANIGADGQQTSVAAAPAAPPTAGVTQNGVCNDQRPVQAVGTTRLFWVHNFKLNMDIQKTFRLVSRTPHVYMWVDLTQFGTVVTQAQADAGAQAFETTYATDRSYFGEPARCDQLPFRQPPRMQELWGQNWYDADDDPHINIVNFDPDVGATVVAGYYSSADEYPLTANAHSNEGEFFYMNSLLFAPDSETYTSILAHEFYHMIQFANDANEETWLNEGMADVAIEVNGFADLTASHTSDYAANAGDQLTAWDGQLYDYGNAYSFMSYLLEHYGPPDNPNTAFHENYALADDVTKQAADGLDGLDAVLAANPFKPQLANYYRNKTVNQVYQDRAVANIVNDITLKVGQYGYGTLSSFQVQPDDQYSTYPQNVTVDGAHVYGNHYYVLDSLADGTFRLEADPTIPVVSNTPTSGTHELWSNRGDEMMTFAQRAANLTGTTSPHLQFNYWYDIEEDYDYAYLQVSTNGGTSWTNLACCGSRTTNPNGNNQGNGITGKSLASPLDTDPSYLAADVDLSPYAGQQILVRFMYQTDPGVNQPGLTLDDVKLVDGATAIWPTATFESGTDGFTVGGNGVQTFLSITPSQPDLATLQLVKLGTTLRVARPARMLSGGHMVVQGAMDAERTIAIVSSLTRLTSEPFSFSFTANATPLGPLQAPTLTDPGTSVVHGHSFNLQWTAAGNAGSLTPSKYRVQRATVSATPLNDGAESGLGAWTATTSGTGAVGWQTSSAKVHSGNNSFWASASEGATNTSSILRFNQPISVPNGATTTLSFWDWHVNESDDQVAAEVSTDGGTTWQPIYQTGRSLIADEASQAFATEPLSQHVIDLGSFAGQTIRLRFRFSAGPDNRAGSTPFGWYLDDLRVDSQNWATLKAVSGTSTTIKAGVAGIKFYRVAAVYTKNFIGPYSNIVDIVVT
jgi:immune inhibitor InhA-like protein